MRSRLFSTEQRNLLDRLFDDEGLAPDRNHIPLRSGDRSRAPLSLAQERVWFFDQMRPGSPLYVMAGALRIRGELDPEVLRRSVCALVDRHEALRTGFAVDDGVPAQVVHAVGALRPPVPVVEVLAEEVSQRIRDLATRGFDLHHPPLLRGLMMRLRDAVEPQWVLVLTLHHIVADGWSLGVLLEELGTVYSALCADTTPDLPELPVQYADFAAWQRSWLTGKVLDGQLTYWREQLAGYSVVDLLPRRQRDGDTFGGDQVPVELPAALVRQLQVVGDAEGATLYMVLVTAFATLLSRWARQDDVVVGAPIAGRRHVELEGLVGFFVNTVPLRIRIDGRAGFRTLMNQVKTVCLDAYRHEDVPFDRVVQELHPDRDTLGQSPIVRHLLVLHNTPPAAMRAPGLHVELLPVHTRTAKFELEFELAPTDNGGLSGWLEFSTDVFDRETARWLAAGMRAVLVGVATDPDHPVWSMPVMTDDARRHVVEELSNAATLPVIWPSVAAWFASVVDTDTDCHHQAVIVDGTDERLTYGELDRAADRLAHRLVGRGSEIESRIGVCFERGTDLIVAILAVLKAGAAFVPLEPSHPNDRLRQVIEDSRPHLIVTTRAESVRLTGLGCDVLCVDDGDATTVPVERVTNTPDGSNTAYVLFTSGSTGRPKGAANTYAALTNRLHWMQNEYGLGRADRVLQKTPIGFDVSIWELLWPLVTGATLVFAQPGEQRYPDHLHDLVDRQQITTCHFVPSMLRAFVDAADNAHPSLRRVFCSGEELSRGLAERFHFLFPGVELHNLYGPTEAAIDVSAHLVTAGGSGPVPIGRPVRGVQLYVLDGNRLPQPVGIPGELYIGGVQLARGYVGRPGLTADRFVPHPFRRGQRLYATGDLVRLLPDGNLEFLGRLDGQVKVRGNRVEPAEIESVLRGHPSVAEALVLGRPAADGMLELAAYLIVDRDVVSADRRAEQVERWRSVFDDTYMDTGHGDPDSDPTFDISGWISSYTGQPLPAVEMAEWVDGIVRRVLSRPHDRVFEIGSGTGLLLFRLAPHCAHYAAADVSEAGMAKLAANLHLLGDVATRVSLDCRPADDFTDVAEDSVDVVLVNSVAQYFPDVDYLLRVLEGAVRAVRPGGAVIVGDVRCRSLHRALKTSVALGRMGEKTPVAELRRTVDQQVERDEELLIDTDLFRAFGDWHPDVSSVLVSPKLGRHRNELTKFRLDVVIQVGDPIEVTAVETVSWSGQAELLDQLRTSPPGRLIVGDIPDARVFSDVRAAELLDTPGMDHATAAGLRIAVDNEPAATVEPAGVVAAVTNLGYLATPVRAGSRPGRFDLLVTRRGVDQVLPTTQEGLPLPPRWRDFTNDPLGVAGRTAITAELRDRVRKRLPEYMMPAHFVVLEAWPTGPTGKVDREALGRIEPARPALTGMYVAPRSSMERAIVDIWAELLDLDRVGVNDNFFDLGGHSLLATRVVSRIRSALGAEVRVQNLLETPTPADLAALIERNTTRHDQAPIRSVDRSRFAVAEPASK